jgi:hypothetical protein
LDRQRDIGDLGARLHGHVLKTQTAAVHVQSLCNGPLDVFEIERLACRFDRLWNAERVNASASPIGHKQRAGISESQLSC